MRGHESQLTLKLGFENISVDGIVLSDLWCLSLSSKTRLKVTMMTDSPPPCPAALMGVVHVLTNPRAQAILIRQATEAHHQSHLVPLQQVDPDYNHPAGVRDLAWGDTSLSQGWVKQ